MSNILPTKSNLIKLKKTISLSKQGQELLEKKKYILMNEKEKYISKKKEIEDKFNEGYKNALLAFQNANIDLGVNKIYNISNNIEIDNSLDIKYKTIMGVDIPIVSYTNNKKPNLTFGLLESSISVDEAIGSFQALKESLVQLASIEITISRLDTAIRKVQTRSNSLKDIIIPNYIADEKRIQDTLDEKDREEFSRMKMIKNRNN